MIASFDKLEGLARINLIAGKSGVGKTHMLESIRRENHDASFLLTPTSFISKDVKRIDVFMHHFDNMYNFALIDEIENGIHYSEYQNVWQQIYELAIEHDIQVFATTHSLEMIHAAHKTIGRDLMYYRLAKVTSGAIGSFDYDYDNLAAAFEMKLEVR